MVYTPTTNKMLKRAVQFYHIRKEKCKKKYGDISEWDVSQILDMKEIFKDLKTSNWGDISKWNVGNVTDMSRMFEGSDFNGDISDWNVENVQYMEGMFRNSEFNGDIGKWNVENVISMRAMFSKSKFAGKYSMEKWSPKRVEDMSYMFNESPFNGDISKWIVIPCPRNCEYMFQHSKFNRDLSNLYISIITSDEILWGDMVDDEDNDQDVFRTYMFYNSKIRLDYIPQSIFSRKAEVFGKYKREFLVNCANKIGEWWLEVNYNPKYKRCRDARWQEFNLALSE